MDTLTITEKDSFLPLYADDVSPLYNEVYRKLLFTDRMFVEDLADIYIFNAPQYAKTNPDAIIEAFEELLDDYDNNDVDLLVNWFSDVVHQDDGYNNLRSQTLEDLTRGYLSAKLAGDEDVDSIKHEPYLTINKKPLFEQAKHVNFDFVSLKGRQLHAYDAKSTVGGFLKHVVAQDSHSELVTVPSDDSNARWVTVIVETNENSQYYLNNVTDFDSGYEKLHYGNLLKNLPEKVNNVDTSEVYFATYAEYGIHSLQTEEAELHFFEHDHVNRIILFFPDDQFSNQGLNILPFQELLSKIFQD